MPGSEAVTGRAVPLGVVVPEEAPIDLKREEADAGVPVAPEAAAARPCGLEARLRLREARTEAPTPKRLGIAVAEPPTALLLLLLLLLLVLLEPSSVSLRLASASSAAYRRSRIAVRSSA